MKLKICLLTMLAVGLAQAESKEAPKKVSEKKKQTPPAEIVIPAGATLVEPGTYSFTDAQGKKWIYRKTPFGIAKFEDKPAETPAAVATAITATEDGDIVRFERPGPFGPYRWQKKKSELTDDERAAWNRSQNQDTATAKPKPE